MNKYKIVTMPTPTAAGSSGLREAEYVPGVCREYDVHNLSGDRRISIDKKRAGRAKRGKGRRKSYIARVLPETIEARQELLMCMGKKQHDAHFGLVEFDNKGDTIELRRDNQVCLVAGDQLKKLSLPTSIRYLDSYNVRLDVVSGVSEDEQDFIRNSGLYRIRSAYTVSVGDVNSLYQKNESAQVCYVVKGRTFDPQPYREADSGSETRIPSGLMIITGRSDTGLGGENTALFNDIYIACLYASSRACKQDSDRAAELRFKLDDFAKTYVEKVQLCAMIYHVACKTGVSKVSFVTKNSIHAKTLSEHLAQFIEGRQGSLLGIMGKKGSVNSFRTMTRMRELICIPPSASTTVPLVSDDSFSKGFLEVIRMYRCSITEFLGLERQTDVFVQSEMHAVKSVVEDADGGEGEGELAVKNAVEAVDADGSEGEGESAEASRPEVFPAVTYIGSRYLKRLGASETRKDVPNLGYWDVQLANVVDAVGKGEPVLRTPALEFLNTTKFRKETETTFVSGDFYDDLGAQGGEKQVLIHIDSTVHSKEQYGNADCIMIRWSKPMVDAIKCSPGDLVEVLIETLYPAFLQISALSGQHGSVARIWMDCIPPAMQRPEVLMPVASVMRYLASKAGISRLQLHSQNPGLVETLRARTPVFDAVTRLLMSNLEELNPEADYTMNQFCSAVFNMDLMHTEIETDGLSLVDLDRLKQSSYVQLERMRRLMGIVERFAQGTEGIYRKGGLNDVIKGLQEENPFNVLKSATNAAGVLMDIELSALLKNMLRDGDAIFRFSLDAEQGFVDAVSKDIVGETITASKTSFEKLLPGFVSRLEPIQKAFYFDLFNHCKEMLKYSAKTLMGAENLAIVFGPNLVTSESLVTLLKYTHQNRKALWLVEYFINHPEIFNPYPYQ